MSPAPHRPTRAAACSACAGRGRRLDAAGRLRACPDCRNDATATLANVAPVACPVCKGDGRLASFAPEDDCPCCLGFGDVPAVSLLPEADRAA